MADAIAIGAKGSGVFLTSSANNPAPSNVDFTGVSRSRKTARDKRNKNSRHDTLRMPHQRQHDQNGRRIKQNLDTTGSRNIADQCAKKFTQ